MDRTQILAEIKRFFDAEELVCNHTLERHKNASWRFLDTMYLWCLLVIRRDILRKPMYCNNHSAGQHQRGLRCNLCELVKSKDRVYLSGHCVDENTEILTTNGWKTRQTISENDTIISMNLNSGFIETAPINFIVDKDYEGKLYEYKGKAINYAVTPEHRMIVKSCDKIYKRVSDRVISEKWAKYLNEKKQTRKWHFGFADEMPTKTDIMVAGKNRGTTCLGDTEMDFLKLCLAVIADGNVNIDKRCPTHKSIRFTLKKERKINELETLLQRLNVSYNKSYAKSREKQGQYGVYAISIRKKDSERIISVIGPNKKIPSSILQLPSGQISELLQYYSLYDGCNIQKDGGKYWSISTSDKDNADLLNAMATLSMHSCSMTARMPRKREINGREVKSSKIHYALSLREREGYRYNKQNLSVVDYKGKVWCVNSDLGTIITRRDGKTMIIGNCLGKAGDFTVAGMTAEEARQKIKQFQHLLPCPIRLEEGVSWLHFDVMPNDAGVKVYGFTEN